MFTILKSITTDENQLKIITLAEQDEKFMKTFTANYQKILLKHNSYKYLKLKDRMLDILAIIKYEQAVLRDYVGTDEYEYVKEEFLSYKKELMAEYMECCNEGLNNLKDSFFNNIITLDEFKENITFFQKNH